MLGVGCGGRGMFLQRADLRRGADVEGFRLGFGLFPTGGGQRLGGLKTGLGRQFGFDSCSWLNGCRFFANQIGSSLCSTPTARIPHVIASSRSLSFFS
jgi:hypothetical protein